MAADGGRGCPGTRPDRLRDSFRDARRRAGRSGWARFRIVGFRRSRTRVDLDRAEGASVTATWSLIPLSIPGILTVAGKPGLDVPVGTLNAILKQAGLRN
jgi:hypothetical protein